MSCFGKILASIARSCAHPLVKGNTGRALAFDWDDVDAITVSDNKVTALTLKESAKAIAIENNVETPFDGTNSASNADDGDRVHTKTFAFRIPERGADVSTKIVDPLVNSVHGFLIIVEKEDKVGDGSYEVLGVESGLKTNADGVTQSETENGGAIMVTMSGTQNVYQYTLAPTPDAGASETQYQASRKLFNLYFEGALTAVY